MDEIIQILIFAGAMIFSVIIQSAKKKKQETPSPQEVLEEVFPELEESPENMETMPGDLQPVKPIVQEPVSPLKRKPFKPQIKPETVKPAAPSPTTSKKPKVRLNNREVAKRAFIYSEIFNRKY